MLNIKQEELESLGWKSLGFQWYQLEKVSGKLEYFTEVKLRKWKNNSAIIAYRGKEEQFIFQGDVENINDFEKLMVQLNIK